MLADPVGAQEVIELSNFLSEYVDMSAILKTPNKELTPMRRAAKNFLRSGQMISAAQVVQKQVQPVGVVTPEKPREPLQALDKSVYAFRRYMSSCGYPANLRCLYLRFFSSMQQGSSSISSMPIPLLDPVIPYENQVLSSSFLLHLCLWR